MLERWLMLRPHTQTSSPLAGRDAGTPCMTSCRAPLTPRDGRCPSPCPCPSCTSMQGEEMEMTQRTARVPPRPRGRRSRGIVNLPLSHVSRQRAAGWIPAAIVTSLFAQSGLVVGG